MTENLEPSKELEMLRSEVEELRSQLAAAQNLITFQNDGAYRTAQLDLARFQAQQTQQINENLEAVKKSLQENLPSIGKGFRNLGELYIRNNKIEL